MTNLSKTLFYWFCRFLFKFYCPLSVYNKKEFPFKSYILCSNHASHMDTIAIMSACGLPFDSFGMLAAKDYFFERSSKMRFFQSLMRLIPIHRQTTRDSLFSDIKSCENFFQENQGVLVIYPEGTRSLTGEIQPFKRGISLIAQHLELPIVPVHICGTFQALKKGWIIPRAANIKVTFGSPIMMDKKMSSKQLTQLLEQTIRTLGGC